MKRIAKNPNIWVENGIFKLDGVPALEVAQEYGTPCFTFLESKIRANCRKLKDELLKILPNLQIFYSVKSNFIPQVCRTVREEGYGVEVISQLEYRYVKQLGFPNTEIQVGGPYLPKPYLQELLEDKVREIVFYNTSGLNYLKELTNTIDFKQNISLFFAPPRYGRRLGFSASSDEIEILSDRIKNIPNVILKTIACHFGTQLQDSEHFTQMASVLLDIITLFEKNGIPITNMNLGGGFPESNAFHRDKIHELGLNLKDLLIQRGFQRLGIIFEPGRYIVADAGVILSSVYHWDENARWAYLNAGNHICPKFSQSKFRFHNISRPLDPNEHKTNFGGVIPSDQDVLAKNYFFTDRVEVGDIVAILNAGAYTITFSNRFPFPFPPIIWICNEKAIPITTTGQLPDLIPLENRN